MKSLLALILVLVVFSCSNIEQVNNESILAQDSPSIQMDSLEVESSSKPTSDSSEQDDCIFDQATQTDDFLKNVDELKGYKWDELSRTATLILETGDTLLISRGGCNHFTVAAEFRLRNDRTDYSNWTKFYQKALWIAKVLDTEFYYEALLEDIYSSKVAIENYSYAYVASFENKMLIDRDYVIERSISPGMTMIKLSTTLN